MTRNYTSSIGIICISSLLFFGSCGNSEQGGNSNQDTLSQKAPIMSLELAWKTDTVLTGSESALYDSARERIYVSCGNTDPSAKDGDGFIAILTVKGKIEELRWVEGLDAPKGMALIDNKLYVSDVDQIRVIDVETGNLEHGVPVEGAVFLNDVCTDGTQIFFSDSRTGKIYAMQQDGQPAVIVEEAPGVNGLEVWRDNLFSLEENGLKMYNIPEYTAVLPDSSVRGGDGVVILNDSTFILSRWEGEIFWLQGAQSYSMLDTRAQESNTADLGWVPEENLVLVPTFMKNELAAYTLEKSDP